MLLSIAGLLATILVAVQPGVAIAADDYLDVETIPLALTPQAVAGIETGEGLAGLQASDTIPLPNAPEMLIIDTAGQSGSFLLRTQSGDGSWTPWLDLEAGAEEAPDGAVGEEGAAGVRGIGPIWLGDDALAMEIVLTSQEPMDVVIESLNSTDTREAATAALVPANAVTGAPAMMPRSAWATAGWRPENAGCDEGPNYAPNVRSIVVHHTVTANNYSQSQVDDILRGIYRLHANTNGWCDIGYNFIVDRFGTIWEARSGGADRPVVGGHTKGFNTWTVGVAILGQFQSGASPAAVRPTAASINAVESIARWKLGLHGIDPLGESWLKNRSTHPPQKFPYNTFVSMPSIVAHRQLGQTACPGNLTIPSIAPMRAALAPAYNAAPPQIPAGRNPEPGPALMTVDLAGGLRAAVGGVPKASPPIPAGTQVVAIAGRGLGGQLLLSNGSLVSYGNASNVSAKPAGARQVVDVSSGSNGGRGWVLEEDGRIYDFGGEPDRTAPVKPAAGQAIALGLAPNGKGYILDRSGGLFAVDGVPARSIGASVNAVDVALRPNGTSGWVLDTTGRLYPFGGAPGWQPELAVQNPRALVVGGVYGGWVLDAEGRLIRFGDERRANPISTTIGSPNIVDVALTDWNYGEGTDDVRYAAALLELFLGVKPSKALADQYGFQLDEFDRGKVITELAQSDAWAGGVIDEMYRDVLGRAPDASGKAFWLGELRGGLRTQDLGALFYGSAEYVADSGTTRAYIRRLYRELLGRSADNGGLAFWAEQLDSGRMSAPEVTLGFYQSPESRRARVVGLYQQILDRLPDPSGYDYWAGQLQIIDDIGLAQELAASAEFRDGVLE